jgi:hypothetical protein
MSVHVWFVVDEVALGQVFLCLRLFLSVSFQQRSIFVFVYILLSPEAHTGETWKSSEKQCCFRKAGALECKVLPLYPFPFPFDFIITLFFRNWVFFRNAAERYSRTGWDWKTVGQRFLVVALAAIGCYEELVGMTNRRLREERQLY